MKAAVRIGAFLALIPATMCAGGMKPACAAQGQDLDAPAVTVRIRFLTRLPDEELPDFEHPTEEEKAAARGLTLLREGRFDDGRKAYGQQTYALEKDLETLAEEAEAAEQWKRALALHDMLMELREPFLWPDLREDWMKADRAYLSLLAKMPEGTLDEAAKEDFASGETYERLADMIDEERFEEPKDREELDRIARVYIEKYPKARLAVTAMLGATMAAWHEEPAEGEGPALAGIRKVDGLLDRMRKAGMSRQALNTVLGTYVYWESDKDDDPDFIARQRRACEGIAAEGTPESRSSWLRSAAHFALEGEDAAGARRLWEQALAVSPTGRDAWDACAGIVRAAIAQGGTDAGLAVLRDLEKQHPDVELSLTLDVLAQAHGEKKEYPRAIALYEETVRRYPDGMTAARALRRIADIYEETGDETKRIATLERAAALLPPDKPLRVGNDLRSFVYESLAEYHVARGNWAEVLRWAKAWKVSSWCANCCDAELRSRRKYIALAHAHLGQFDECLAAVERVDDWHFPDVAQALVDAFHAKGRMQALADKLRAVPEDSKQGEVAEFASQYVAFVELADAKNVAALWRKCEFDGRHAIGYDWRRDAVSRLVAGIGDEAKPFLLTRIASPGDEGQYVVYTLARMKDPRVLDILKREIPTFDSEYEFERAFKTLGLLGTPEAYELLQHYSEKGTDDQQRAADAILRKYPNPR